MDEGVARRRQLTGVKMLASVAPAAVDEVVLDGYMPYRAEISSLASDTAARRACSEAQKLRPMFRQ